jgi:sucrose-6-phosphate hydrolase SacC (GH32 family)
MTRTTLIASVAGVAAALVASFVAGVPAVHRAQASAPNTIENPSFETGDLTGWTVLEGDAFADAGVSDAVDWGWGCCFNAVGSYHYWGHAAGGDGLTGRMRSSTFTLDGIGQITFLLGGGNDIDNLYVALMRESDDTELMRATNARFDDSERLHRVVWDASAHVGEQLYFLVVDEATGGWGHINLDDFQTYHEDSAFEIVNPGFESGDLTGWTVLEGDAFTDAGVTDAEDWGWGCCFDRVGDYHFWGAVAGDEATGRMRSTTFVLGGSGRIEFLIGGGNDIDNLYVALMRESDDAELMRATNSAFDDSERLNRVAWDASDHLGDELYLLVVDEATGGWGHINLDDVKVNVDVIGPVIANHSFETGDLTGWTVVEGDAFGPEQVTDERLDGMHGRYHLWGAHGVSDDATGELRSSRFLLSGDGVIELLVGGDDDPDLFVAAVRAEDDTELIRATGPGHEEYSAVTWDLADHVGEELYIRVVDDSPTGHLNLDGVQTLRSAPMHWPLDETSGTLAADVAGGVDDYVNYVFNDAADKPDSDPLWRAGVHAGALLFDGYSTWLTRPADRAFVPGSTLTIEAWVAPRSYEWGDLGQASVIVNQHNVRANAGYLLGMYRHGRLGFEVGDGLEWHRLSTPDGHELPTGQWSHVVGTYDGDIGAMALYVNGEPVASADVPAGRFVLPSSADMIVGRHNTAAQLGPFHANMWNGLIDELRISSEVPTSEQVAAAYTAGLGPDGSLPVADVEADRSRYDGDRYRPQYHFVPPEHWMNEPHAPIYYDGQYHIFYQHNPQGPYWHQIHWGHAVSDDLVHWRDLPIALAPTKDSPAPDGIWSGSATHDAEGNPVLFFTAGDDSAEVFQRTGLARPLDDDLIDWEMHPEPVTVQDPDLHADEGEVWYGHFRDPFVWPETDESGVTTWYQLVTSGIREPGGGAPIGGTALVYTSTDLIDWEYHGPLFVGDLEAYPESSPIWELPVLLPIGEDADGDQKHIFLINPHWPGFHPLNAKTVAYWIGTWDRDAKRFIPDDDAPRLLDHGHHFTGPSGMVTPDGRTVMFTITQDGRSDPDHYDAGWAHSMGLPIELSLRDDGTAGVAPIAELESLRHEQVVSVRNVGLDAANAALDAARPDLTDLLEVEVELQLRRPEAGGANHAGIEVRRSADGRERTVFQIDREEQTYSVDRTFSSLDPDPRKGVHEGEFTVSPNGKVTFRVYIDRSSIEAFANDSVLTTRVYPVLADSLGVRLFADGDVKVKSLRVWNLASIYGESAPAHFDAPRDLGYVVDLPNHDFQSCDLTGWTVVEGDAFSDAHVTDVDDWGWNGPFRQAHAWGSDDRCHLWGFNEEAGGDALTGVLRSDEFTLGGDGQIDFLIAGGHDPDRLYVALVDAGTDEMLLSETGTNWGQYVRRHWDASEYVGRQLYIEVVDRATGGWGHISIDNVNVPVRPEG